MDKYIKAQDLIDRIYPVDPENDGSDGCTVVYQNLTLSSPEIEAIVEELPAADVAPVVHGKWKPTEYPIMSECEDCSECGYRTVYGHGFKFCPNCGAKMDGGNNETD